MQRATILALAIALAGCGSSSLRRDNEVQATLPRAIGLGSFAPACIFFCVVHVSFEQGDVFQHEAESADVKARMEEEYKSQLRIGKPP